MLREFSIISVSIINLILTVAYCRMIYKKKIKPALAMWVFFTLAVGISLTTYLHEGNFSIWDNILNTTDLGLVGTVMLFIIFTGEKSSKFNKFDVGCLIAVIVIILFWAFTYNHTITNISIQVIMVIAYFPVIKRMLKAKKNTEPFSVWIGIFLVAVISLLSGKGILANIYALRAIFCTVFLLLLMIRIEVKSKEIRPIKK